MYKETKKRVIFEKKAVSEIIAYVILIAITISVSFLVYKMLQGISPPNPIDCEQGTSLIINDVKIVDNLSVDKKTGKFKLIVQE